MSVKEPEPLAEILPGSRVVSGLSASSGCTGVGRIAWWAVIAAVAVFHPASALAQVGCIQGNNVQPNPPLSYNYNTTIFSPPGGIIGSVGPYNFKSQASGGCNQPNQTSDYTNGDSGGNGQTGTSINSANNNPIIYGTGTSNQSPSSAALISSGAGYGGDGGQGGRAPSNFGSATTGGAGGRGGMGGSITVNFDLPLFFPFPFGASPPDTRLIVSTVGGNGGYGGDSTSYSLQPTYGGAGGVGGSTQALMVEASGTFDPASTGIMAVAGGGNGGQGGYSYFVFNTSFGGPGGMGGAGGPVSLVFSGGSVQAGTIGLLANSSGGTGGDGGGAAPDDGATGGNGGQGGQGGLVTVRLLSGTVALLQTATSSQQTAAIYAQSNGGSGGAGGKVNGVFGAGGGNGGAGGAGGSASADITGAVSLTGPNQAGNADGVGVLVQSNGGTGGIGGNESSLGGQAGGGGPAGLGGSAVLMVGASGPGAASGSINTTGNFAHGAVVQSVGGGGGSGGQASFSGSGGNGGFGGNGGTATVNVPNGTIVTLGTNSIGAVAQSIGGGGGAGGDARGIEVVSALVIGGNGAQGGSGGKVTVNLGNAVIGSSSLTKSSNSSLPTTMGGGGVLAQSIGGAGGVAGSASSTGAGLIAIVLGGTGGPGGSGSDVTVTNTGGVVTTFGDHAPGVEAQSIGGGGGKGGSVTNFSSNLGPTAAISVGGQGGSGGDGGSVKIANAGQVATYGTDAPGVMLQSIGGGGGSGGSAAASAVSISPSKFIPAVSVSVALGGAGGGGGKGMAVQLDNSGLITTGGDGSVGVIAQSVGGGGGSGGDSSASSYASGRQSAVKLAISVAVGGKGGDGGNGGEVTINNSGVIATAGQDAYGVLAQSVGGGGGVGSGGDASSTTGDAKASFDTAIAVGGTGGGGGNGNTVTLSNTGAITTRGDASHGIFAQSVGGGGGAAGGGAASASATTLSVGVAVGATGGNGGDGGSVKATNAGLILTRGTSAHGIVVQSIGGGGGMAGKAGATAGGTTGISSIQSLFDTISKGLGLNQGVIDKGNGIFQIGEYGENIVASFNELKGIFAQPQADDPEEGSSPSIQVSVSVGGAGGTGGKGLDATAINTGTIMTLGAESDGIYAQSVGGGGGSGGAATSTSAANDDMSYQTAIAVGGKGGGGGNGGNVTVTNAAGAMLQTQGVAAFGIMAQSVGGGGGEGSVAGTVDGSLKSFGVGLGGNGGGGGDGGKVVVTNDGTLSTTGKNGIGIFAQSIGGGGGLVRSITTDQTFDPSKIINNPQGRVADIQGLTLNLGGHNGANGKGGDVTVNVTSNGTITTTGLDAHGIVAQSIGGGGGAVIGGQTSLTPKGDNDTRGDGGSVNVTVTRQQPMPFGNPQLVTSGVGAAAIIAQSIGGGGGLAGDLSKVTYFAPGTNGQVSTGTGNGGEVKIGLTNTFVQTNGENAPAIIAQSIGGGGGLFVGPTGLTAYAGNANGAGSNKGGPVTINLVGTGVQANGLNSSAIIANSAGDNGNNGPITITIDAKSGVTGGGGGGSGGPTPAINLIFGAQNRVENQGTIVSSYNDPSNGVAIASNVTTAGNTIIVNSGTIEGSVLAPSQSGSSVVNLAGGTISARVIDLGTKGQLTNAGTLEVGGKGRVGTTTLTGDFVQTATGTLAIDIDPARNGQDRLQVNGQANVAGTVLARRISSVNLRPGTASLPLLTATGGVTVDAQTSVVGGTPVVAYQLVSSDGSTVGLQTTVDFAGSRALGAQGLLSANRSEVGRALNTAFATNPGLLETLGSRLAVLPTGGSLAATLDALSGEAVADVQQAAFSTQRLFGNSLLAHATNAMPGSGAYAMAALSTVPPPNDAGLRVWAGGFGGSDALNANDGLGSLHTQIAGGLIGLDKWFGPDRMVGISIGGGSTDFVVPDRGGQGHGTSVQVGGYGMASFGRAYVSGVVYYGNLATIVQRQNLGGATGLSANGRGSVSDNVLGGQAELGWHQPLGRYTLAPFASLEVDHLWQSPLGETELGPDAAGLGLHYAPAQRTSVPLTLGTRVDTAFTVAGRSAAVAAKLGWAHEFNTTRSLQAAFSAAPGAGFQVLGASPAANVAVVELNGILAVTRNVALLGTFTGRFAETETAVGGFGGLQVKW